MKALTLTQPWATLVAIGAKWVETRSWGTNYRGPLAIHAAKGFPAEARDLLLREPFSSTLHRAGVITSDLPLGSVVAICRLLDCFEMTEEWIAAVKEPERSFGHYEPGRFAWILGKVERLAEPIPAKGSLGLWWWQDEPHQNQPFGNSRQYVGRGERLTRPLSKVRLSRLA